MMTLGALLVLLLVAWLAMAWWHAHKPLPAGLGVTAPWREAHALRLLADETFYDAQQRRHCRQAIFDEMFRLIGQARRLVVIDIFQFNDPNDTDDDCHRRLAQELCTVLLNRKAAVPELEMILITDSINSVYGGRPTPHLDALQKAGIRVVVTNLAPSRDPNPSWSALWRLFFRWLGNTPRGGWLSNPLGPGKVTLRSYLAVLNFNANHRKTLVVDHGNDWMAVVSSSNADDGSSAYLDTALRFAGPAALDLLAAESAIAGLSGLGHTELPAMPAVTTALPSLPRLRVLTEGAIREALLAIIDDARDDERLDLAVLYLSHRGVIQALKNAHRRGVSIRILLDPNRAHFGRPSPGIPNCQVAWELHRAGLSIRWYDTPGDLAHSKVLLRSGGERPAELLLGSANFTRRSLDDFNLEADILLCADQQHPVIRERLATFERHWHNRAGERFSAPFDTHVDPSRWRYWRYRWMEASGWSTF
ncbi:phospholipase D-like domain-containing protein [Litchfieldella rifensis]|uniref:Phospholipase D-like domain-containing protein n=1 Tax=Litchfieldella rifensis TaxID=762643 RepID=A0ABV7LL47_9GAMM